MISLEVGLPYHMNRVTPAVGLYLFVYLSHVKASDRVTLRYITRDDLKLHFAPIPNSHLIFLACWGPLGISSQIFYFNLCKHLDMHKIN